MTHEEERLLMLSLHYGNMKLYVAKLLDAFERLRELAYLGPHGDEARRIAREALEVEPPPHPLKDFYKDGWHTGHPFTEYMDLPMHPGDDYVDVDERIMSARKRAHQEAALTLTWTQSSDLLRHGSFAGPPWLEVWKATDADGYEVATVANDGSWYWSAYPPAQPGQTGTGPATSLDDAKVQVGKFLGL